MKSNKRRAILSIGLVMGILMIVVICGNERQCKSKLEVPTEFPDEKVNTEGYIHFSVEHFRTTIVGICEEVTR